MGVFWQTVGLLALSTIFMTFAWYAHLKDLAGKPWFIAALIAWGIAFFEYMLQVPANRIGNTRFTVGQLKILQEAIALAVFVPFSVYYLGEPIHWKYILACGFILAAVWCVFFL